MVVIIEANKAEMYEEQTNIRSRGVEEMLRIWLDTEVTARPSLRGARLAARVRKEAMVE